MGAGGGEMGRSVAGPRASDCFRAEVRLEAVVGDGGGGSGSGESNSIFVSCWAPAVVSCCDSSSAAAEALRSLISTGDDDGIVSCAFEFGGEVIVDASAPEDVAVDGSTGGVLFRHVPRQPILVFCSAAKVQLRLPMRPYDQCPAQANCNGC